MMSIGNGLLLFAILGLALAHPACNNSEEYEESVETNEWPDSVEVICRRGCPRILSPVCAVDENDDNNFKYFHNQCLMEYDGCRRGRAWKPTQMLQCITDVDPVLRDDCVHACPFIYDPVCASTVSDGTAADGEYLQIFGNRCIFGMENCLASGKWLEVRGEVCGLAGKDD